MYNFFLKNDYIFCEMPSGKVCEGGKKNVEIHLTEHIEGAKLSTKNLNNWNNLVVNYSDVTVEGVHLPIDEFVEWKTKNTQIIGGDTSGMEEILSDILTELKNDDSFQLFEDTDGNVLFSKIDDDGVLKFYKADGSEYTGDVKPYSREVQQTITDYCADSVPYSLIQLRDADTKEVIVSIWRNDNDLSESNTAPANKVKGACVVPPIDYTTLLTSIDTKLNLLTDIKDKLTDANATLINIENETIEINTNLTTLIQKATDQITELQGIKSELVAGNLKLDEIVIKLTNIDSNISAIKTDITAIKDSVASIDLKLDDVILKLLDVVDLIENSNTLLQSLLDELNVSIEIESYEKNNGTINYLQKDTIIWNNETGTQISKTTEYSINGIDWTATAPAGAVNLGFIQPPANTFAQDTFQLTDCEGTPIGVPQEVIKVVNLGTNKNTICNTDEISDPIVEAINNASKGKKQDLLSWVASTTETLEIPLSKFSTISLLASKGEFKIENTNNDFSSDFTIAGGTLETFIEISSDGIGTETGATDLPNSIDTRANAYDMDIANNFFRIECIRDGVLTIEVYK